MKKKVKWGSIIIVIFVILIIGTCFFLGYEHFSNSNKPNTPIKYEKVKKIEEPKIEEYSASLVMVGDALIHSSVYRDANRLAGYNGYDFKPQISYIKEKVKNFDLAYYNQETILGGTGLGLSDYPMFNSPQEVGDAMLDAGFNVTSLATNHTIDSGANAIISSRNYWNTKKDVVAVGSYSSFDEKKAIESQVHEINGITYAILNYTYGTNGLIVPGGQEYLVNVWPTDLYLNDVANDNAYQNYKETVKNDIAAVRDKVDVLMVAMHWGVEYTHEPTAYERDMAKFLADNGVDIIIGTHPHVIQPVEWIDDTIVFYSLGNFISAQYQNQGSCTNYKCMVGLMSSLDITKTVNDGKTEIKIDNIQNDLIFTSYDPYSWSNFKVIPFSHPDIKNYAWNYRDIYNTYANVINSNDERIKTVPLGA